MREGMNDECALDGATRAGTQALPLPNSVIHPRTILPNETRKQPTPQHSGAEMHRALPPPQL